MTLVGAGSNSKRATLPNGVTERFFSQRKKHSIVLSYDSAGSGRTIRTRRAGRRRTQSQVINIQLALPFKTHNPVPPSALFGPQATVGRRRPKPITQTREKKTK